MSAAPKLSLPQKLELNDLLAELHRQGFVAREEAQNLAKRLSRSNQHPLVLLSEAAIPDRRNPNQTLSMDALGGWLGRHVGMEFVRIDPLKLNLEIVGQVLPHAYALRLGVVPLEVNEDHIVIAVSDPYAAEWVEEIERMTKKRIERKLASPLQIRQLLDEVFVVQKAFKRFARESGNGQVREREKLLKSGKTAELDQLLEKGRQKKFGGQDSSVAAIVDWLLNFALSERASDIHLEPKRGLGFIRFRVDGNLRVVYKLDPEALSVVIARFKILGDMKLDEKRRPLDGRIKRFLDNGKHLEMRLSTVPTQFGEKMVIRIFDQAAAGKDLAFIGFNPVDQKMWEEMVNQAQGLILVTGPTGSGKTTTLYTTLNRIATPEVNVCTAEDPIEMVVDSFNQVQVNNQVGLGFAECIRSFLRQDPDIIMVGEIRDQETGEMAIQSSLTGHLVFSTLHTNGALATIQRLVDLGLPSFLINSSLQGILAQRLVRKLCPHCKEEVPCDEDRWKTMLDGHELSMPEKMFVARGCDECKQTGYIGRLCVYELVKFDDKIKKIVHAEVEIVELIEKSRGLFTPLRVNGARKVAEGLTTIEEILKVAY